MCGDNAAVGVGRSEITVSKTKIEWADRVWNPVTGCTKISPGCQNCYAERMSKRLAGRCGYPKDDPFMVTLHPERLDEPLHWRKTSRIFVCSMADLFHDDVPTKFIIDCLSIMAEAYQHTFMILTKRPERMREILTHETIANDVWLQTSRGVNAEPSPWPLPNVWLGVTAENQEQANKRIPVLLQIPAAVRFVSVEPMLGPVDLRNLKYDGDILDAMAGEYLSTDGSEAYVPWNKLDWVICGGESGPRARPMHRDWVRSLRDQCQAAETSFFFKQWGEWSPAEIEDDSYMLGGRAINDPRGGRMSVAKFPLHTRNNRYWRLDENHLAVKVGKKIAGRLLDGREWNEFPEATS